MLKYFEVTGFRNFSETIKFNFSDVRDYKFNANNIKESLISKAMVYGKNSVGKSNLGNALVDAAHRIKMNLQNRDMSFLNRNGAKYAKFKYIFIFDGSEISYEYKINKAQEMSYEKIEIEGNIFFEYNRDTDEKDITGLRNEDININDNFSKVKCVFSYILNNHPFEDDHLMKKMSKFATGMVYFRSLDVINITSVLNRELLGGRMEEFMNFIFQDNNMQEFQELLYGAGINDEITQEITPTGKELYVKYPDGNLPFLQVASSGARALYSWFFLIKVYKEATFMFIDEFDACYHHDLSEAIVNYVNKKQELQVVLTSHNTDLLSNKITRPDCLFIMTKNKLTSFANATKRELREGHNLEKLYQSGEFNQQ